MSVLRLSDEDTEVYDVMLDALNESYHTEKNELKSRSAALKIQIRFFVSPHFVAFQSDISLAISSAHTRVSCSHVLPDRK
jgi:hypothetical protein